VLVETSQGVACICGDVIYDIANQVVQPFHQVLFDEAQTTGNQGTSKRQDKAAIRKALNSGRYVLPMHDRPALIDRARVVGRLLESVPGPVVAVEDYPGPTTAEIEAARRRGALRETIPA
jgi:hypothetical protein